MMNGYHSGMDAGWWIVMAIFWVVLIGLIIWALLRLFPGRGRSAEGAQGENPRQLLDRRLASGEIDTGTYDQLRERIDRGALAGGR